MGHKSSKRHSASGSSFKPFITSHIFATEDKIIQLKVVAEMKLKMQKNFLVHFFMSLCKQIYNTHYTSSFFHLHFLFVFPATGRIYGSFFLQNLLLYLSWFNKWMRSCQVLSRSLNESQKNVVNKRWIVYVLHWK